MYLILILLVFGVGMFLLFKRTNSIQENQIEVLEDDRTLLPKRALVKTDILFRFVERDMTLGRTNKLVFYYQYEQHYIGVELLNGKLVFNYDGKIYQTMNDLKNTAIINSRRIADCNDLVTLTEIIYPDTKIQALLENDPLLKDSIVDGTDKRYNMNVIKEEI